MSVQYDLEGQKRAYEKWAPIYDKVYLKLLADGQRKAAFAAAACGPDILEIGVGTGLVLRDVNWLGDEPLADIGPDGLAVRAKVRSTRPASAARVSPLGPREAEVELIDGETGVAPGQACAFYDDMTGERVLGGGIIASAARVEAAAERMSEAAA